jgi:hypothetical protein
MSHNFELAIKKELTVKDALQLATSSIQVGRTLVKDINSPD